MEKKETKKYTNEEKKEMVSKYLKSKYGEEFEGISYAPGDIMQGHDEFYMKPQNGTQEDVFTVTGSYNRDGIYEILDGYLGILIRPEYEKAMRGLIDDFYGEYKTYTAIRNGDLAMRWYNVKKISGMNPKDEITNVDMDTHVYVKQSIAAGIDVKDTVRKIALKMVENKLVGEIDINIIRDDRYNLIKLDRENWQKASGSENLVEDYSLRVTKDLKVVDYRKGE